MEKKIHALKAAYRAGDAIKLRRAAQSLVTYERRHSMSLVINPGAGKYVELARKICEAPSLSL